MSSQLEFNGKLTVTELLNNSLVKVSVTLAERSVRYCAEKYNFDAEEALRLLNLVSTRMEVSSSRSVKGEKVSSSKMPLPFNGEMNTNCCHALRQNKGLYTQCTSSKCEDSDYCKSCLKMVEKSSNKMPEYGRIEDRMAVDIFEYVDPKGRKPIAYTKVMKKLNLTREQVEEEAEKLNIKINEKHFELVEETKRGRPKGEKEEKVKGPKGRPKKEKLVLEIEGDETEDIFASIVQSANKSEEKEEKEEKELLEMLEAEKEAKKQAAEAKKAEEKAEKEAKLAAEKEAKKLAVEEKKAQEKAEKEAKIAAEKEAKKQAAEAKKAQEKAEKEAKIAAEKAEKEAKKAQEKAEKEAKLAAEKAEKEAKIAAEKEAKKQAAEAKKLAEKEAKKQPKVTVKHVSEVKEEKEEEPDVVKKIEFEGKKYLKSKKTGVIYDLEVYMTTQEQMIVGKWNDVTNKIEFIKEEMEELVEEEVDEEDEEEEEEEEVRNIFESDEE